MSHWLAGHSFTQTIMLICGLVICLGAVIKLIATLLGGQWYLFGATLMILVGIACYTVAIALPVSPRGRSLIGDLVFVGGFSSFAGIILRMMHRRSKLASKLPKTRAAVHSDEVWPPPPTAPSNDQRK